MRAVTPTSSHPSAIRSKGVHTRCNIVIYTRPGTAPGYTTQGDNPHKVENILRSIFNRMLRARYFIPLISYVFLSNNNVALKYKK